MENVLTFPTFPHGKLPVTNYAPGRLYVPQMGQCAVRFAVVSFHWQYKKLYKNPPIDFKISTGVKFFTIIAIMPKQPSIQFAHQQQSMQRKKMLITEHNNLSPKYNMTMLKQFRESNPEMKSNPIR